MTRLPIAIASNVPLLVAGVETVAAKAGYRVETARDPIEWVRAKASRDERALLVVATRGWQWVELVARASKVPTLGVVAVLEESTAEMYAAVIRAGATGAIPWTAPADHLLLTLDAATAGHAVLPAPIARSLASSDVQWVASTEQLECLELLAQGRTVAVIASRFHCSEREMFRRLRLLYRSLGATTRSDAVLGAARLGLISFATRALDEELS